MKCKEDTDLVAKFRHTLKEIKQSAGVLSTQEAATKNTFINVKYLQNMMVKAHE